MEPQAGPSLFSSEEVIYGSSFDVFQEVIAEEEVHDIDVVESSSSPSSIANEIYSNENSMSSYAASETTQNKYWTREDLTPSEVLPDNLFTENEEDVKSFALDLAAVDTAVDMTDEPGGFASLTSLFPIKEEPDETEAPSASTAKPAELTEENVKKVTRRKIKQEPAAPPPPK